MAISHNRFKARFIHFSIKGLDIETEYFSMTYLFNKFSNAATEA